MTYWSASVPKSIFKQTRTNYRGSDHAKCHIWTSTILLIEVEHSVASAWTRCSPRRSQFECNFYYNIYGASASSLWNEMESERLLISRDMTKCVCVVVVGGLLGGGCMRWARITLLMTQNNKLFKQLAGTVHSQYMANDTLIILFAL